MTDDLRHRLAALTREPVPGENDLPVPVLQSRVRRGRAVRTGGIGAVAAVTLLGAALAAQALPGPDRAPDVPAVTATPTPAPSPTPSQMAYPTPIPSGPRCTTSTANMPNICLEMGPAPVESPEPDPTAAPVVGLTSAGELVLLDPASGETIRVVTQDPAFSGGTLTVAPDGGTAYVVARTEADQFAWPTIVRVSLSDGATGTVDRGYGPSLSPDGSTLAYIGPPDDTTTDVFDGRGLVLLDVASGERRYVPDDDTGLPDFMRILGDPSWATDGSSVLLTSGWANEMGPASVAVAVLDVSAPPATLVSAPEIFAESEGVVGDVFRMRAFGDVWALPDGRVTATEFESTTPAGTEREQPTWRTVQSLVVLRGGVAERRIVLPVQPDDSLSEQVVVSSLTPRPNGADLLVTITRENWETGATESSLWVWDGQDTLRELRSGIAAVDS